MEFEHLNGGESKPFSIHGIDFYPAFRHSDHPLLRAKGYAWIIRDLGVLTEDSLAELARCDIRLLVVNGAPWKLPLQEALYRHLLSGQGKEDSIIVLGNPAPPNGFKKTSCFAAYPMIPVPPLTNPFQITSGEFRVFEKMITGV